MYTGSLNDSLKIPSSWENYRDLWSMAEAREILTAHPLHLDIELTSQCNLKCEMCWQNGLLQEAKQGMMKFEVFKKVIDEGIPLGLTAIKLQSRGESTLHPQLARYSRYAKEAGIQDIQLTTNGTLLGKEGSIEEILTCGLDKLIFSVDDEHDKSALEIYKSNVPDVKKIVHETMTTREKLGLTKPAIRIQCIPSENQNMEGKLKEVQNEFPLADEYMVNELWNADTSGENGNDLSSTHEMFPCAYLWTRVVIFWNGDVALCCRDYNNFHKLGNVEQESVKTLWTSPKMQGLRKAHLAGQRGQIAICKDCEHGIRPKIDVGRKPFIYEVKSKG